MVKKWAVRARAPRARAKQKAHYDGGCMHKGVYGVEGKVVRLLFITAKYRQAIEHMGWGGGFVRRDRGTVSASIRAG